jgi:hypothetical protein
MDVRENSGFFEKVTHKMIIKEEGVQKQLPWLN